MPDAEVREALVAYYMKVEGLEREVAESQADNYLEMVLRYRNTLAMLEEGLVRRIQGGQQ